jgi:8-oxo-dGTP pyrophosphatase MutT (NUDIX family)
MGKFLIGDWIGKTAKLAIGASAIIFDEARGSVFLTQRPDNSRWCLPGGSMDPEERTKETCIREVLEETGSLVRESRQVGI